MKTYPMPKFDQTVSSGKALESMTLKVPTARTPTSSKVRQATAARCAPGRFEARAMVAAR
jgi:hypothetical protein